jgi:valyl-tRNA synthetase
MYNIRDWCISRQIWWGHQIPAWTCEDCREIIVAMEAPILPGMRFQHLDPGHRCAGHLVQFGPVALFHHGLAGADQLLKTYYPTGAGHRIRHPLFLGGPHDDDGHSFHGGRPLFATFTSMPWCATKHGKKMSKSKGNVIDPLNVIDAYGTDAFRFTLAAFAAQGRDIKMSEKRVEGYRNFINKLWNAARFALMHLDRGYDTIDKQHISLQDRWILSRLNRVTRQTGSRVWTLTSSTRPPGCDLSVRLARIV